MGVRANATAVKNRINRLKSSLSSIADGAAFEIAQDTIDRVSIATSTQYAVRAQEQVGFDMGQFLSNIQGLFRNGAGSYSILDTDKMGSTEDIDAIYRQKGLWHFGTGRGEVFRTRVFNDPSARADVEAGRLAVWHPRTPQWTILEDGAGSGAMGGPIPPSRAIGNIKADERTIYSRWRNNILRQMRGRGIL